MAKYLFLDVDGVLNSTKSALALGGAAWPDNDNASLFLDQVAVGLIKRIQRNGVQIVLSSSWRLEILEGRATASDMRWRTGIPFDAITPDLGHGRGFDIDKVVESTKQGDLVCIVDDEVEDLLYKQYQYTVQTNDDEGLTFADYERICEILDIPV